MKQSHCPNLADCPNLPDFTLAIIMTSGSGRNAVQKSIFSSGGAILFGSQQNNLCNCSKGHYRTHLYEFILSLDLTRSRTNDGQRTRTWTLDQVHIEPVNQVR